MNRFQFVADHSEAFEVKRLCQVVGVARSSYYDWLAAAPRRAVRAAQDTVLAAQIRDVQDPARGGDRALGAPRVTAELNEGRKPAERVNRKRVARVMREHGIAGIRLRRRVRTTTPDPSGRKYPDLLQRDFTAPEINSRYVGDITYVPIADGTNWYLATVIDLHSRKLVGWALADHMRTELVTDALRMAHQVRGNLRGAIFHCDHGSVYCSKAYAEVCESFGVLQSMGGIGSSADNALAESFNASYKRETLAGAAAFPDVAAARRETFRWVNRYNTRRRHSAIGNVAPDVYEKSLTTRDTVSRSTTITEAA